MKKIRSFILVLCAIMTVACSSHRQNKEGGEDRQTSTEIVLTDAQTQKLSVRTGDLLEHRFKNWMTANGRLKAMPQSMAAVTSLMGANVKNILVTEGQRVVRGQVLAYLSHPDLLELQSRYLTASSRMTYVYQEYLRQKKLYSAKVGSGKDFQQIQSEYHTLRGEIRTLGSQLQLLGIRPASVRRGKVITRIAVVSPISGIIERVNVQTGQYADPQMTLFNVVNTEHLFADLMVFEKDISKIRPGQFAVMTVQSAGRKIHGTVTSIGKVFDDQTHAVHVRVSINGSKNGLISGMYVQARISTAPVQRQAIPSDGVVDEGGIKYIFTVTEKQGKWHFQPQAIQTGIEEGGFTEILTPMGRHSEYALGNAYDLMSELKKGETGESD
ncbi:efflux RND transporter periplasmic adaptor subunit [Prevotella cerevisiae]|uniref:Efflux RND transporter periplasmic adaptor subunit n=1 Tax=Segatella cerevisiae TaxID=2053716 RepID=A0ABT1BWU6_9BACT|nr:efflux RND transporter periplasmic adaptor subunit [Segatella cerevisiae]MCO6024917.1 efflux RND transporter periplasmic adaptor subunit [Segatella cerevisiae]